MSYKAEDSNGVYDNDQTGYATFYNFLPVGAEFVVAMYDANGLSGGVIGPCQWIHRSCVLGYFVTDDIMPRAFTDSVGSEVSGCTADTPGMSNIYLSSPSSYLCNGQSNQVTVTGLSAGAPDYVSIFSSPYVSHKRTIRTVLSWY